MSPEEPEQLSPLVTRVLAANPGIMTGPGTNTYLVGTDSLVVIDAGPDDATHLDAVYSAVGGRRVEAVLCTHHHIDHAPGTVPFAQRVGAPVLARRHADGPVVERELEDGDEVGPLRALFTPGHASDHLCFWFDGEHAMFSGDHIMSGSTVVIAPPDGHMDTYLRSLQRVLELAPTRIYPGHGPVIEDGRRVIQDYIHHREERRQQVAAALAVGDRTVKEIVARVYEGVEEKFHPIARHSVLAHLHQLRDAGRASTQEDALDLESVWVVRDG